MPRTRSAFLVVHGIAATMLLSVSAWATDPNCCCTAHSTPSCSNTACSSTVCQIDPYCCSVMWDGTCAAEAAQYCGSAAPFCRDGNSDGIPDVCAASGGGGSTTNPADCDADGIPDLNETGYSGKTSWIGPTSGSGVPFETAQWWNFGRPGTASFTEVTMPYSQYYSNLQMTMGCDNAVRAFNLIDDGTTILHDFELNLGGRTLRLAGPSSDTLRFTPRVYYTLRASLSSGVLMATDNGLNLVDQGALQVALNSVTVNATSFAWSSTVASLSPALVLQNSTINASAFSWPPAIQGSAVYPTLEMVGVSMLQFTPSATGAGASFAIPDTATLRVTSNGANDFAKLSGTGLQVTEQPGSMIDLGGTLTVDGTLNLGGATSGRSMCTVGSQMCSASRLNAQNLVYPAPNTNASITWGIDLSGASGTTPDGDASIRVSGTASISGTLTVNDMSNGRPPQLGFSVPLVRAEQYASGKDNFDLVRAYGMDMMQLPVGYYVGTERSGSRINVVVKRGSPVAATTPVSSTLTTQPTKMIVVDDGSHFGLPLVAYATPGVQGGTSISLKKINQSQGTVTNFATIFAAADLTDMIATDLTGDGVPELVTSHGTGGFVRAYSLLGTSPTTLWTCQYPVGTRVECLCALPSGGRAFMPTGSSVGTGTSSGSKGSVGTITSTGSASGATEVAVVPKTLNGTDIDNDGSSDIVAGGESSSAAFTVTPTGAVQIIKRGLTGGFTVLPAVATSGVPTALAVADLDGDGKRDVVASCGQLGSGYPVGARPTGVVLRGAPINGAGSSPSMLRPPVAIDVGSSYAQGTGVALVDADGDGYLDIALGWQDGSVNYGGAAIIPVRDQRTSGGLTLGAQLNFAGSGVAQLRPLGTSSVVTLRANFTSFTGGTSLVQDTFAAAPVEGDLDGDGFVGTSDVALLLLDFGPCASQPCEGDLDGDGVVGTGDLAYILLLFN